ncbi:MAG TPA: cob(I)yrinic acid a,c-diamide adenosyltransferase [Puia sp.]|jgi:cob(I)alamin adenosyltransferase
MSMRIYTKTGDKGSTSLIGGTKVPKSHLRIESYGTVDELNSFIGLLNDQLALAGTSSPSPLPDLLPATPLFADTHPFLREIQDRLFTIGASLACDPEKEPKLKIPDLKEEDLTALEKAIDQMDATLPPMKSFLLPGGHLAVSTAHVARCVCRRAERSCVRLQEESLYVEPIVIRYLNRLSDYLFMLSRYTGHLLNAPEIPWKPRT